MNSGLLSTFLQAGTGSHDGWDGHSHGTGWLLHFASKRLGEAMVFAVTLPKNQLGRQRTRSRCRCGYGWAISLANCCHSLSLGACPVSQLLMILQARLWIARRLVQVGPPIHPSI